MIKIFQEVKMFACFRKVLHPDVLVEVSSRSVFEVKRFAAHIDALPFMDCENGVKTQPESSPWNHLTEVMEAGEDCASSRVCRFS